MPTRRGKHIRQDIGLVASDSLPRRWPPLQHHPSLRGLRRPGPGDARCRSRISDRKCETWRTSELPHVQDLQYHLVRHTGSVAIAAHARYGWWWKKVQKRDRRMPKSTKQCRQQANEGGNSCSLQHVYRFTEVNKLIFDFCCYCRFSQRYGDKQGLSTVGNV